MYRCPYARVKRFPLSNTPLFFASRWYCEKRGCWCPVRGDAGKCRYYLKLMDKKGALISFIFSSP